MLEMELRLKMNIWNKRLALLLGLALLVAAAPSRGADTKIGQVDLKKIFEGFYKTKAADTQLKERANDSEKVLKGMVDDFTKAQEEYKKTVDSSTDQSVSADERDKRKKNAETKLLELQEIQRSVQQFRSQTQTTLDEQKKRMRDEILKAIRDVIDSKSKKAGYTLVFDTAAESVNQTQVILYNSGNNDFTDEVLAEINKDAPADLPKATETPKPTTDVKPLPESLSPKKIK
jgi:outer membrane protein